MADRVKRILAWRIRYFVYICDWRDIFMTEPEGKYEIGYGRNTEHYLCVWDGKGTMHYISETTTPTSNELTQAKILTMLFRIAEKLGIDVRL